MDWRWGDAIGLGSSMAKVADSMYNHSYIGTYRHEYFSLRVLSTHVLKL